MHSDLIKAVIRAEHELRVREARGARRVPERPGLRLRRRRPRSE
jgi:hypothetical protein